MSVPIDDDQECGMSCNYILFIDFNVPPIPLDMSLSGLELTFHTIMTINLNATLDNCAIYLVLE